MSDVEADDDYTDFTCSECDGEGVRLVCPDDMCRGAGECFHGDGYATCWCCKGSGEHAAEGSL